MASVAPPILKTAVSVLPFSNSDLTKLKNLAAPVLRNQPKRIFGQSRFRELSYYAGRAAAAILFESCGLDAWVEPNPIFGFLLLKTNEKRTGFVNISHTNGMAVAALSSGAVGIDIESIDRKVQKVLPRVSSNRELHEIESRFLERNGVQIPESVALWSAKEAVSKAVGLGIKFGLRDFQIFFEGPSPYRVDLLRTGPVPLARPAVSVFHAAGFVIALCGEKDQLTQPVGLTVYEPRKL